MYSVAVGATGAATPDASPWLEAVLALNDMPVLRWLPAVLFFAGLLWLAYATHPRRTETLNERSEREVEEARR